MSVNVQINGVDVLFGDDVPRIFVKDCKPTQAFASVLDVAEETEPLFTLSQTERDPPIQGEDRTTARGFVRKILMLSGISNASMDERAHWIAAHCINFLSSSTTQSSMPGPVELTSMTSQVEKNVRASIAFLFDTAELGSDMITQAAGETSHKRAKSTSTDRTKWAQIMVLIISFARVHNLESCANLPLSLKAFWELQTKDLQISYNGDKFMGAVPDTFLCFDIISRLLLGYQYSQEYVADSALLSSWGWSVFFDSFDALDPADIQPGMIHVKLGVPSRNGERKTRIVDGPTDVPIVYGDVLDESEIPITFWPGIFAGKLTATLVGYYRNDAFSVVQIYEWEMDGKQKKWRLGFRDKQEMCLKFTVLSQCPCVDNLTDEESKTWINELIEGGLLERPGNLRGPEIVGVIPGYPPAKETFASSPEKVFCTANKIPNTIGDCQIVWFFYATTNAAARWLALDGLDQLKGETAGFSGILRSKSCCVRCACRAVVSKSFVLL